MYHNPNNDNFKRIMQETLDRIATESAKWAKADAARKELSNAVDVARRTLNPTVYNVFDGGTFLGHIMANANAYNGFRENL